MESVDGSGEGRRGTGGNFRLIAEEEDENKFMDFLPFSERERGKDESLKMDFHFYHSSLFHRLSLCYSEK